MSYGRSKSRKSNYTAPSSNWKNLTAEEANGPEFKGSIWYSTTGVKSKFGLSTDNLRTITGYRPAQKHYGGGNNRTLYRERDLVLFMDQRDGRTFATPEAIEERRLEFRKQAVDAEQAKRDRGNTDSIVPAERLVNLQLGRLTAMVRYYEGDDCVVGVALKNKTEWIKNLVDRIINAGYTVEKERARKKEIRAAEQKVIEAARQRQLEAHRAQEAKRVEYEAKRVEKEKLKAAKLAKIASGKLGWDDLSYSELQKESTIRKLLLGGLSSRKADLVLRIVRYESETVEERKSTALLYLEQSKQKKMLDKAKFIEEQRLRNERYQAERDKQRLREEENAKKEKTRREKVAKTIALIACGKARWEELKNQTLQEECRKRHLDPYGNKGKMIERIKKYEKEIKGKK